MKNEIIEAIEKIEKVIKLLKSKKLSQQEIDYVLTFSSQMVENFLFKSNAIVFKLNKNMIKNNRDLKIKIKYEGEIISSIEMHKFLFQLKTLFSILLAKKQFFNFFIFFEINMILNFYISSSIKNKSFDSLNKKFKITELEYHEQTIMYKYLFSIFDKLIFTTNFVANKRIDSKIEIDKNLVFTKDFYLIAKPFFKSMSKKENTKIYLKLLNQSESFHFIRKLRNNLEHSFTDPKLEYNIALETELLFIIVCRTLIQIHTDFKNDNEIFKTIKLDV